MKMNPFSRVLVQLMDRKGTSIRDLYRSTGIPPSTLSEWTAGRVPRLTPELLKLCDYFGVTLETFLNAPSESDASMSGGKTTPTPAELRAYLLQIRKISNEALRTLEDTTHEPEQENEKETV